MGLIKYSSFQKKLGDVGLTISQITCRVYDDKSIILEASIIGKSAAAKPMIIEKSFSKALCILDGEDLYDLIYKLWHLAIDQKLFIKANSLFTEVIEWDWGEGPDTGKFIKRLITKDELTNLPEFA